MSHVAAAVWALASLGLPLARESSSSQSPQDPPWSTQPRTPFPTWGFQRSPSPGGGVAAVEEGALSRPACPAPGRGGARSSHSRGRRGSLSCWLHLACGACGHRCGSEAIRRGGGWGGVKPGSLCRAHRPGPSTAAVLLSVFRAAGSAHLSSHHQASSEDSGRGYLPCFSGGEGRQRPETVCRLFQA